MEKNATATCVQCHKELNCSIDDDGIKSRIFVCTNCKCPNYGLLCISQEKMPEEK